VKAELLRCVSKANVSLLTCTLLVDSMVRQRIGMHTLPNDVVATFAWQCEAPV
jgi:hypothetical protein